MYTDFLSRLKYHSQRTVIESKYGRANKVFIQGFGQFLCRKKLVACDPCALVSAHPFAHRVDSGMYTVWGLVLTPLFQNGTQSHSIERTAANFLLKASSSFSRRYFRTSCLNIQCNPSPISTTNSSPKLATMGLSAGFFLQCSFLI